MLEQPHCLLLNKLSHHVAQDCSHSVKSLVCSTNVRKTDIIQQNLLYNEDRHRFAQFRARLHDAKAKRDDLRGKKKINNIRRIILDKRTNNAKGREAQVFERARLRSRVKERVEKQRNMRFSRRSQHYIIKLKYMRSLRTVQK